MDVCFDECCKICQRARKGNEMTTTTNTASFTIINGNTFSATPEEMKKRLEDLGYKIEDPVTVKWRDGDIVLYDEVAYRRRDGGWRPTEHTTLNYLHGEHGLDKPLGDLFLKGKVTLVVRDGRPVFGGLVAKNFSFYAAGEGLVLRGDKSISVFDLEEAMS